MAEAPLSDAITAVASQGTAASFAAFIEIFLDARVGLLAQNVPADHLPGETFQTGPSDRMSLALVGTQDGRRMVKACADPSLFVQRYPDTQINILMVAASSLGWLQGSTSRTGSWYAAQRPFNPSRSIGLRRPGRLHLGARRRADPGGSCGDETGRGRLDGQE
jgi:hypothetical protein